MMAAGMERNEDGSYTAWQYSNKFTGTYEECRRWLWQHGENV